jgi:N-acetylmuramoyl-L-alanine amidase-like protein
MPGRDHSRPSLAFHVEINPPEDLDVVSKRVEPPAVTEDEEDAELSRLFLSAAGAQDVISRVQHFAEALRGKPYVSHPLIGSRDQAEALVTGVLGFDCVTFVETVLALARSESPAHFRQELVLLRYRGGAISWEERHHYFSDWLAENERRGVLEINTRGQGSERIESRLAVLEGLPPRDTAFEVVPTRSLERAIPRIANGSVVAFASEREGLDYFHVGLLFFEKPGELLLVHAAKSIGSVGKEPLAAFLERNQMRGISFARPLDPRRTMP